MKRLYILCEGQTEDDFVNIILSPYLQNMDINTTSIICTTKRTLTKKYKGGVSSYGKIKKELVRLCSEHQNEMVTTMFDYYGLPHDTPGINDDCCGIYEKIENIENLIMHDVNASRGNLIFNLVLHEFEGLLFSEISAFNNIADNETLALFQGVRASFKTPEHINNLPETAPSKRIKAAIPNYSKIHDGIEIAGRIGVDKISRECKHFKRWICKLVDWAKDSTQ